MKDRLGKILIALAAIAIGCPILYLAVILLFAVIKFIAMTVWGILCSIWTILCIPFALLDALIQCGGVLLPAAGLLIAIYLVLACVFRANPLKTLFDKDFWKGALLVAFFPVTFWFIVGAALMKDKRCK